MKVNVNGVYKGDTIWINVNGVWKQGVTWINVNGVWKQELAQINYPYVTDQLKLYFDAKDITNPSHNWKDLSGNNNNAVLNFFDYTTTDGWTGSKLQFDGSNSFASVAYKEDLKLNGKFSIEMILSTIATASWKAIIGYDYGSSGWILYRNSTNIVNLSRVGTSSSFTLANATQDNHICLTYDEISLRWYVNGKLLTTTAIRLPDTIAQKNLFIGKSANNAFLNMGVKFLRLYTKELSDVEVLQNYNVS